MIQEENTGRSSYLFTYLTPAVCELVVTFMLFLPCVFSQLLHQPPYALGSIPHHLRRYTAHTPLGRDPHI
jgi:hypothetical protein